MTTSEDKRPGRARSERSIKAEAAFRARVTELGGTVLEPMWLGALKPHYVQCATGHEIAIRPNDVQQGQGICRICARKDANLAEVAFRARVAGLGGIVLEPIYLGAHVPQRVLCPLGHETTLRPNSVQKGRGICRTCAGRDPTAAEAEFRTRVIQLGGTVLEAAWLGSHNPHQVICATGHVCAPRPDGLRKGEGICALCAGKRWDVFYVVTDDDKGHLKFGVTSGDPRPRLTDHRTEGYVTIRRTLTNLPDLVALDIERAVLSALRMAKELPIRGREYFSAHVLGTVLDIVDNYPIPGLSLPHQHQKVSGQRLEL